MVKRRQLLVFIFYFLILFVNVKTAKEELINGNIQDQKIKKKKDFFSNEEWRRDIKRRNYFN